MAQDPDSQAREAIMSRAHKARARGRVLDYRPAIRETHGPAQGHDHNGRVLDITDEEIEGIWVPWNPPAGP